MDKFLKPERFDADPNSSTAVKQWLHWHRTFSNFLVAIATHDPDKLSMLINHVGPSVYEYIAECETYDAAVNVLKALYVKPKNEELNTEHAKKAHLDLSGEHSGDTGDGSAHGPDGYNTTQLRWIHGRHRDDPPKDSVEEWISQHAEPMLRRYILQQASFNDIEKQPTLQDLGGKSEESNENITRIADKLIAAGQKLDADEMLQQEINKIPLRMSYKVFMTVVNQVFLRGISWGCVATLFYFAYKLIMRVFTSGLMDFIPTLMMRVHEAICFYIAPWISKQGGWAFLLNYIFGETPLDSGPKTLTKIILSFL